MTCSLRCDHNTVTGVEGSKKHAFLTGSKNYKISTIVDLEKSKVT